MKWISRISFVILLVLLIDFNCRHLKGAHKADPNLLVTNLILSSLILILLISTKIKRRS
jgi:hypothetical protein